MVVRHYPSAMRTDRKRQDLLDRQGQAPRKAADALRGSVWRRVQSSAPSGAFMGHADHQQLPGTDV